MYTFIRRLQKKPDHQKRAILVGLMVVSIVVVGGFWLVSLDSRFSRSEVFVGANSTPDKQEDQALAVAGPFASLTRSLGTGVASVKEQFAGLQKQFSGEGEEDEVVPAWPLPVDSQ